MNRISMTLIKLFVILPLALFGFRAAYADEDLSLDSAKAQLAQAQAEYDAELQKASSIKSQLEELTAKAFEAQNEKAKTQENFNSIVVSQYRNGTVMPFLTLIFDSQSMTDFFRNLDYANFIMSKMVELIQKQDQARRNYDASIGDLNASLDSYNASLSAANEKKNHMQALVDEATAKLNVKAEEIKGDSPAPDPQPAPVPGDWKSGEASAYGGESDPGAGTRTATGDSITESSMGVAIPMSWPNYRELFGHAIQIRYNGKIVMAVINDCGGFGGNRCLDLQPGVFHAFGAGSCQSWGARNVEYVIL